MLEIIEKVDWYSKTLLTEQYEDLFFSTKYENIHVKKPEYNQACAFCVAEVFSPLTFACHKPWEHSHFDLFKSIYPDVETLRNLQFDEN